MNSSFSQKQSFNVSNHGRRNVLKFKRDIPVRHLPTIRDDTTVVWLEDSQFSSIIENNTQLQTFTWIDRCSILFYSNMTRCIKYLKRVRSREYVIIVIISYPIEAMHKMIYRLQQYRIVQTIYIVSSKGNAIDYFPSIIGNIVIFQDKNSMLNRLELLINDIQEEKFEGGLFTTFDSNAKALKNIREEPASFLSFHVFKVLVTSMSCDSLAAKQEMLTECRAYYRNDPTQLSQINEFEHTYEPNDAIRWYTKPGFLFSIINKALRSGEIQALYTFRYFIKNICDRLEEASASRANTSFRLYRGAILHRDEVKSLGIGFLVATTSFFSCSRDRRVAEMFISVDSSTGKSPSPGREEKQQYVLFEIDVDLTKFQDTIVTDVSAQSEFPVEQEMVFMLGSVFIIKEINYDSEKNIWNIQMRSVSDITRSVQKREEYIRLRLQENSSMLWFGHTLVTIENDYLYSIDYFHRLLRTLPINHTDRPVVYFNLGRIYRFIEKYHKSLAYLRCARLLLRRLLPEGIFDYCRILGHIGIVYSELGDSKRALKWLEQAVSLQQKSLPDNHTEIPFHLNRVAYGYFKVKQFKHALSILYNADHFFKTRMSIEHHYHAQTLHTFGLVYRALDDDEKAYSYFKEAFHKRESLVIKDHPSIASTCYQLSLMHEDRGEYELALEYAKRSLRIQSIKLPHYHSELKQSIELVERLQLHQKLHDTA